MKVAQLLILLVLVIGLDSSSADTESAELRDWRTAKVSRNLVRVSADEFTEAIARKLEKAHEEKPYEDGYTELLLDRVFEDPSTSNRVFAFHVRYVHDIWVVFVVDSSGRITDNFVLSRWEMYED